MLLAIDTSAGTSVAVVGGDSLLAWDGALAPGRALASCRVLAEAIVTDTMRHAEVVGELIAAVLEESGAAVGALSGVVAGMGPGPFTGLRVGIAAAKAFAVGAGVPLAPVVSHDAVAAERYSTGHSGPLLVVTDARRRERYWTAYSGVDRLGLPVRCGGPGLSRPEELPHSQWPRFDATVVSSGWLGMLAAARAAQGVPQDSDEPLYLRSPDVTLAGPKRVGP